MPRYFVENKGKWNIFSTIVDDFLFDEFVCITALKVRLLYEEHKRIEEDINSLLTDRPKVNVMSYEEAMKLIRKNENNSEKPNNCTNCECTDDCTECKEAEHGCKDEPQFDKDINVRSKDEPQYDIDKGTIKCDNCSENGTFKCSKCDDEMYFKRLEVEDEPQTQLTAKCLECNNSKACKENHWQGCRYEPLGYEVTAVVGTIKGEPQACSTCKHKGDERYCRDCYEYSLYEKDEPQTCEECEHWSDTEDGCADRHGCTMTERSE